MSSSSSSDMVETDLETQAPSRSAMPEVMLSFDNSVGGAWDDRELIRAYDAALDEFHVHHPGPGSWLDKMTAAMKKGQPLEGAAPTKTAWYSASASKAALNPAQAGPSQPATKKRRILSKREKAVAETAATNPYDPIAYNTSPRAHFTSPPSPSYVPPSPGAGAEDEEDDNGDEGWYDESYALSQNAPQYDPSGSSAAYAGPSGNSSSNAMGVYPAPSIGVQPATEVNTFEAMSYAMTAQYWAGYWMGVAQTKAAAPTPAQLPSNAIHQAAPGPTRRSAPTRRIAQPEVEEGAAAHEADPAQPSNVFVTRKQYGVPNVNGLKR